MIFGDICAHANPLEGDSGLRIFSGRTSGSQSRDCASIFSFVSDRATLSNYYLVILQQCMPYEILVYSLFFFILFLLQDFQTLLQHS